MNAHSQNLIDNPASYVIISKQTKQVLCEIFNKDIITKINTDKYQVMGIAEYLIEYNRSI